jgi:prevent-host-death family protein
MGEGNFVGANELQKKPDQLLRKVAATGETCYITQDGKAKAVLLDVNRYNALMDIVEDAEAAKPIPIGDETRKQISVQGVIRRKTNRPPKRRK